MSTRGQLVCLYSGYAFFILYLFGIVVVAGFIPPPAPCWSADAIAAFFGQHRGRILGRHVHLRVCLGALRALGRGDSSVRCCGSNDRNSRR